MNWFLVGLPYCVLIVWVSIFYVRMKNKNNKEMSQRVASRLLGNNSTIVQGLSFKPHKGGRKRGHKGRKK